MEACERLPPWADRFISLSLEVKRELLLITCVNSAPPRPEAGAPFATAKADSESHGLGIPAMRRVAERCDGALELRQEGGVFTLRAALRVPQPSE